MNNETNETGNDDPTEFQQDQLDCKFCGKNFETKKKKQSHEKRCSAKDSKTEEPFQCDICKQTFKYLAGKTKHERKHDPPGGFLCSFCNEPFTSDVKRAIHRETVHKAFKCQICNEKFTSDDSYQQHIQEKHNGNDRRLFVCSDCGVQYKTQMQLKQHIESKCGTLRVFACKECGSKFMTQNTLNAHLLIHNGEKKHLCNFCGTSFLSKGQLKVHERCHTGEKPFKCDICGKAFSYRESLVTHSSVHTGIKPYLCECCGSRFSCIGNLIKHRRSRPNSCGLPQFNKNTKVAPRASSKSCAILEFITETDSLVKNSNSIEAKINENVIQSTTETAAVTTTQINKQQPANRSVTKPVQIIANVINVTNLLIPTLMPISSSSTSTPSTPSTYPHNQLILSTPIESSKFQKRETSTSSSDILAESLKNSNIKIETVINEFTINTKMKPETEDGQKCTQQQRQQQQSHQLESIEEYQIDSKNNETIEIQYISESEFKAIENEGAGDGITVIPRKDTDNNDNDDIKINEEFTAEPFQISFINELDGNNDRTTEEYDDTWQNESIVYEDDTQKASICFVDYNEVVDHITIRSDQNQVEEENREQAEVEEAEGEEEAELVVPEIIDETIPITEYGSITEITETQQMSTTRNNINSSALNYSDATKTPQSNNNVRFEIYLQGQEEQIRVIRDGDDENVADECVENVEIGENDEEMKEETDVVTLEILPNNDYGSSGTDNEIESQSNILNESLSTMEISNVTSKSELSLNSTKTNADTKATISAESNRLSFHDDSNSDFEIYSTEKQFECQHCPKQYTMFKVYRKHMQIEHQVTIESVPEIPKHRRRCKKSKKNELTCGICKKSYLSRAVLKKHEAQHGTDGTLIYKCLCCPRYFATVNQVEQHQRAQHLDKLLCKVCNKMFKDPDNLNAHVRYTHSKDTTTPTTPQKKYLYVCVRCGRNFSSKLALSDHERGECGEKPIYKCNVCVKSYHSAGSLKTHMSIHTGELPHLCKFCGKAFRTQGQVKVHERKHSGEKPFKCEFCAKSFAYRESLLTHLSVHTGVKRFMCQGCGLRFSCISNLQAHRKSHKNTCGKMPKCTKPCGPMEIVKYPAEVKNE